MFAIPKRGLRVDRKIRNEHPLVQIECFVPDSEVLNILSAHQEIEWVNLMGNVA